MDLPVALAEAGARSATPSGWEVAIVAYRSRPLVESLLARLPDAVPVVVVDNASGVDGLAEVAAARPGTRYLDGGGVGFARAANLAARAARSPVAVFVNPDSAPTAEQLEALVADVRGDPGLAGVAATTVLPHGGVELGVGGWEPTVARTIVHALGLHRVFPRAGLYARPAPGEEIRVGWLSGACLAVPREQFLALGGFDEAYFVYNEDMGFGRRARAAGLGLRLRTDILVPHAGGGSGAPPVRMFRMRGASMSRYLATHNGRVAATAMRVLLAVGTLARAGACLLTWRGRLARAHAAYVRGLFTGPPDLNS